MHFLGFMTFASFIIYLSIGGFVFYLNPRSHLNRLFSLICLAFAVWAFAYSFFILAPDKESAWLWYRVSAAGWTLVPALIFHFILKLANKESVLRRRWILFLIYLPGCFFLFKSTTGILFTQDVIHSRLGWVGVVKISLWSVSYDLYYALCLITGFVIIYFWGWTSSHPPNKQQARIIVFTGIPTLILVIVFSRIIPSLGGVHPLPSIAPIVLLIWIFGILYAMARFKLMVLSPETAAQDILETMVDSLLLLDENLTIQKVNRATLDLLKYDEAKLIGKPIFSIFSQDKVLEGAPLEQLIKSSPVRSHEITFKAENGETISLSLSASPVRGENDSPLGTVIILRDVSKLKRIEEQLRFMASYDSLTLLPNRMLLNDRLQQALGRARRFQHTVALLLMDMDRFKDVNDTFGHDVGDLLLKAVAERIKRNLRENDTAARLGGDEFVVVLTDLENSDSVSQVAGKIVESFSQPLIINSHELRITASIGISLFPTDANDAEGLYKNADQALYRAKDNNRNNYQFYSSAVSASELEKISVERNFRDAIEAEEFKLFYHPVFDLDSGRMTSIEAVVRWMHPDLGLVSPMDFIPSAEKTGLIGLIDEWVLRTACRQNKAWQDERFPAVPVSVNVSPQQFKHAGLNDTIKTILGDTGLRPEFLMLEISESVVVSNVDKSIEIMKGLRELGVRIVLDNFGSGYSSLAWLRHLPVEALKIDSFLIKNIADDPNTAFFVKAIILLAHSLNMQAIAKGIETGEQLERLRSLRLEEPFSLKCDQGQGFLFSKPVTGEDLTRLFLQPAKS